MNAQTPHHAFGTVLSRRLGFSSGVDLVPFNTCTYDCIYCQLRHPVTLVDFKAGVEDVSRGVITSLDWVVGVIDPTYAGVQPALTLQTLLDQMRAGRMPATRHLHSPELVKLTEDAYRVARTKGALYVLNKVPDAATSPLVL